MSRPLLLRSSCTSAAAANGFAAAAANSRSTVAVTAPGTLTQGRGACGLPVSRISKPAVVISPGVACGSSATATQTQGSRWTSSPTRAASADAASTASRARPLSGPNASGSARSSARTAADEEIIFLAAARSGRVARAHVPDVLEAELVERAGGGTVDRFEDERRVIAHLTADPDRTGEPRARLLEDRQVEGTLPPGAPGELVDLVAGLLAEERRELLSGGVEQVHREVIGVAGDAMGVVGPRDAHQVARRLDAALGVESDEATATLPTLRDRRDNRHRVADGAHRVVKGALSRHRVRSSSDRPDRSTDCHRPRRRRPTSRASHHAPRRRVMKISRWWRSEASDRWTAC
ncbi:exported hypothetical protein [Frankia sp. AgKG'84/4]